MEYLGPNGVAQELVLIDQVPNLMKTDDLGPDRPMQCALRKFQAPHILESPGIDNFP